MLEWPERTVYEALAAVADRRPDATALVFDGETVGYGTLVDRSLAFARGLADRGIGEGDAIAVWLANRPAWIYAQVAASYLGASVVAVNTRYRTNELEYLLADSGAAVLLLEESVLGRDLLGMAADVAPGLSEDSPELFDPDAFPRLEFVVSVDSAPAYGAVIPLEELAADPPADPEPTGDATTPVSVFYTSGTTGDPKGCVHDSRSVLNHSYNVGSYFDLGDADRGLGAMPFCGIFGHNVWLSCLSHGIPLVVQPYFDPGTTLDLVDRHGVTYLSATAQMLLRTIDADAFAPGRVETLRKGAVFFANGFDDAGFERIEAATNLPIVQPYGLSEANTQLFVGDPDASKGQRKKVGGPLIHEDVEAKVVDPDTRAELASGERGELALRGYNVMQGYLGEPEATAEAFDDEGWFYTGDICERDGQDRFYFHSRVDDALRVRGFLVSPREIEAAIDGHPDVDVSQVVGAPHPRHGEVPVAFVTPAGDVDGSDVVAYLEGRIADFKVPEDVIVVDAFPRTEGPHGDKIRKGALRERVADRY